MVSDRAGYPPLRILRTGTSTMQSFQKFPQTWTSSRDLCSVAVISRMSNSCKHCEKAHKVCKSCDPAFPPFTRAVCKTCWDREPKQQCTRSKHHLPASSFEFSHGNDTDTSGDQERSSVKYFYQEDPYECESAWAPLYVRKQLQTR
jgi:hypothetical protein